MYRRSIRRGTISTNPIPVMKPTTVRLDAERTRKKQEIKAKTNQSLTDIVNKAIDKEHRKL